MASTPRGRAVPTSGGRLCISIYIILPAVVVLPGRWRDVWRCVRLLRLYLQSAEGRRQSLWRGFPAHVSGAGARVIGALA